MPELQGGQLEVVAVAETAVVPPRGYLRTMLASDFFHKVGETYATHIVKIILGLFTSVLISRMLGPSGRGLFAIAGAIGALGVQFANFGLHSSNTYFVARDHKLAGTLTGNALMVSFGFGGLLALALAALFKFRPTLVGIGGALLALAVIWIPVGLAYLLLSNLLIGLNDIRGFNIAEFLQRSIPLVLLIGLALLHSKSVAALFSVAVIALIVSLVFVFLRLSQRLTSPLHTSSELFKQNLHYSTKAYLQTAFAFLVLRSDLFLVEHIRGAAETGYYSIAATMADTISLLAFSVGTILFPKISALTDIQQKLRLTRKATIGTGIIMLPLLGVGCLLARPAVHLLYGAAFLPSVQPFILLAPGMFFLCTHAVAVQFLNSIGYPKMVVVVWGGCAVLNIALNLWAVPRWGMSGAAAVSSLCYGLAALFVLWMIPVYSRKATLEAS